LKTKNSTTVAGEFAASAQGVYTLLVQNGPSGPQSNTLSFSVLASSRPVIFDGGVTSTATFQGPLARGAVASLFGRELSEGVAAADRTPLPRRLAGVSVEVNGVDAPLWYVSPQQINFQVPFESPLAGPVFIAVVRDGVRSEPSKIVLQAYAPGIFTFQAEDGARIPIVTHAGGALVTSDNPARTGDYIVIWGTGVGDLAAEPRTGEVSPADPPAEAKAPPVIAIGGVVAEVDFAGLTPGAVGLVQFNVRVPELPQERTSADMVIRFGDVSSLPVKLSIGGKGH
jgi:uncharacterized protein (TIGR03437 family)